MVDLEDPSILYSAGDVLRRDGACEQRGRFERDSGAFDAPGEVFSACAGAALYRRAAIAAAGGFDERLGTYLEDVELGLRLRLAGWRCRWEPRAVARHAGGGLERRAAPRPRRVGRAQHAAARGALLPPPLAAARGLPPARVGVARRARGAAARAPRRRADGAAAAPRVRARARRRGRPGRGRHPAAADPRAPRGRPPVARTRDDDALVAERHRERPLREPEPLRRRRAHPAAAPTARPAPRSSSRS